MSDRVVPSVGLITIWYRSTREKDRFVANLRALRRGHAMPVFVVSQVPDDEVEVLRRAVPEARVLRSATNLGTTGSWNIGIRCLLTAGVQYIGTWNVDVTLDPDCLSRLVATMESDPTIGACQPLLLYSDDPRRVEMYGGSLDLRTGAGCHDYKGTTDLAALPDLRDVQYLDGGTMLARADVLRTVGEFDERFFMYHEDTDMSLRIQRAGCRTVAVRDARAWHHHRENKGSFPPPYQLFYETRNRFYFVRKHAGHGSLGRLIVKTAWGLPRRVVYYLRRRKTTLARAYLAGVICGMGSVMGKRGWVG